jgi:exodeoxyribonuclease VII large subunit
MIDQSQQAAQPSLFRDIYTVSRLNHSAKQLLENGFPALVWVEGEISNLSLPASGHAYFSLKDAQSQVRCALFRAQLRRIETKLQDGIRVVLRARVSLYEGRGEFQLVVEQLEEAGEGALRRALEVLKRQLHQQGLFDVSHKKPLPRLPKRIGLLTSTSGAVLHDIVITLRRRFPAIPVLLHPIPVQGEGAAAQIASTIALACARQECDALILARGGGSLEDLWAFNEEVVARAIYASEIPIVCGVGHETDVTIADLVADMRAPTPTAAAELLSPNQDEWLGYFQYHQNRLVKLATDALATRQQKLDWLTTRLVHPRQRIRIALDQLHNLERRLRLASLAQRRARSTQLLALTGRLNQCSPQARLRAFAQRYQHLSSRLAAGMQYYLEHQRQCLRASAQGLHALSPLATLQRGYAIVQRADTGTVVRDALELKQGDQVNARVARGRLHCLVKDVEDA